MMCFSRLALVFDLWRSHIDAACFWCLCPFLIRSILSFLLPNDFLCQCMFLRCACTLACIFGCRLICRRWCCRKTRRGMGIVGNCGMGWQLLATDLMEWRSLPHQMLLNHYELQDGRPTHGELKLDLHLARIGNGSQLPLSGNCHSVFNKRHYINYGGYLSGNNLFKPPWVSVQQIGNESCDRCTLCKSRKGGLVCCNDGHLQSAQHTKNVVEWFKLYEVRCLSSGACAAGASTPSSPATASTVAPAPQVPPGVWNMEWGDSWGMEWRSPPPRLSGGGMSMLDHLSAQEPVLLREAEDDCVATP